MSTVRACAHLGALTSLAGALIGAGTALCAMAPPGLSAVPDAVARLTLAQSASATTIASVVRPRA